MPKTWTDKYKKKRKPERKRLIEALDKLWSMIIRKAGKCLYCGKTENLQAHHIITRSIMSLRWELANGVCLCPGCHTLSSKFSAHKTPIEFIQWFGMERYNALKFLNNTKKFKASVDTLKLLKIYLESELKKLVDDWRE